MGLGALTVGSLEERLHRAQAVAARPFPAAAPMPPPLCWGDRECGGGDAEVGWNAGVGGGARRWWGHRRRRMAEQQTSSQNSVTRGVGGVQDRTSSPGRHDCSESVIKSRDDEGRRGADSIAR